MKSRFGCNDSGFTLIELMITLVVFSFGLMALSGLQAMMIRANSFNKDFPIATAIAANLVEEAKASDYGMLAGGALNASPPAGYGDRNGNGKMDPGDLDLDGDNVPDDPYGGRFTWERTVLGTGTVLGPTAPGAYVVNVFVYWPNRFKPDEPHTLHLTEIIP